jgi:hypothetical protein
MSPAMILRTAGWAIEQLLDARQYITRISVGRVGLEPTTGGL